MNALGVTHDEAGTTPREVDALAWQFVLRESRPHVRNLRRQLSYPETTSVRNAFHLVDSLLSGIPIPKACCAGTELPTARQAGLTKPIVPSSADGPSRPTPSVGHGQSIARHES